MNILQSPPKIKTGIVGKLHFQTQTKSFVFLKDLSIEFGRGQHVLILTCHISCQEEPCPEHHQSIASALLKATTLHKINVQDLNLRANGVLCAVLCPRIHTQEKCMDSCHRLTQSFLEICGIPEERRFLVKIKKSSVLPVIRNTEAGVKPPIDAGNPPSGHHNPINQRTSPAQRCGHTTPHKHGRFPM